MPSLRMSNQSHKKAYGKQFHFQLTAKKKAYVTYGLWDARMGGGDQGLLTNPFSSFSIQIHSIVGKEKHVSCQRDL